jgi:hypothetical protein
MKKYVELQMNDLMMRGFENHHNQDICVVMFHGFTGNKMETNRMFLKIDQMLEKNAISSLRFDWFGHGESDLEFSDLTVNLLIKQGKTILNYAKNHYKKIYLLGFSMGGLIALNLLDFDPEKLILISPAINMADIASSIYSSNPKFDKDLVDLRGFHLSKNFVESFKDMAYHGLISQYHQPILLIHGNKDQSVSIEVSRSLVKAYPSINFIEVLGADHGYGSNAYMTRVIQSIQQFIG